MTEAEMEKLRMEIRIQTLEDLVAQFLRAILEVNPQVMPVFQERIDRLFAKVRVHKLSDPVESMEERKTALARLSSQVQSALNEI